ncbi:ADP-ribosylglycohydrolase family protein [Zobellia amurskyensis]|uniref:ADP-ribosylglycohydrolase family protein n=1 Tax=Zobellia amurskyensis TaxID=248905 RepID=A0A7X3D0W6_9FLAO|nr:ADP-ribosylglycohydrolase family protein [Zobellia amurskyensis]MUH34878.1 ADP-ribosylglycohydrolase family protein [Zobellia amurskyensis]
MKRLIICVLTLLFISCKENSTPLDIPAPKEDAYTSDTLSLSEKVYYDKVLGALVGSAIGDAMGASTEMWSRKDIQLKYGYITTLTPAVRQQSPEGTWDHNLIAGATTDDTRWKYAMVKYLSKNKGDFNATNFTHFITEYYASLTKTISDNGSVPDTDFLDTQIEKIDWIKEWARVSMAYQKDTETYLKAMNRFYGGEMSCAGQLYTPMFGLISNSPEDSYTLAYDHTLFDLGYAKDISSLVSAMTHMALRTKNIDSIINTATFVDPLGYQDSRLVGRISYNIADASVKKILSIKQLVLADTLTPQDSILFKIPEGFNGTQKEWTRQELAYQFLEENEKAIPFHSGEIWQILITALEYGEGDFEKTLQFIVNYGRDNDTVAAVAGMILGAKDGYSNLPIALRTQALKVNKENMGIDLEALALEMVEKKHIDLRNP